MLYADGNGHAEKWKDGRGGAHELGEGRGPRAAGGDPGLREVLSCRGEEFVPASGERKNGRGTCALRSVRVEVGTGEFLSETEKHHSSHAESKEGEESVASLRTKASVTATQSSADERGALRGRRWALRAWQDAGRAQPTARVGGEGA